MRWLPVWWIGSLPSISSRPRAVSQTPTSSWESCTGMSQRASGNTVTFTGPAGVSVTAQLQGSVGWANGTDQLCIVPFSNSQTTLSTPDGGQTTYWLLVTSVTPGGKKLVLGSGQINAVDSGQGKGLICPDPS